MTHNEAKGLNEIVAQFTNDRVTSGITVIDDTNAWVAIHLDGRLVTTVNSVQQFNDLISLGWFLNTEQEPISNEQRENEIDNQVNLSRPGK